VELFLLRKRTTSDQRQKKIIKYVENFPLQTIRNIADNYNEKYSNYLVIKREVEKLVTNKILFVLGNTKTYYFVPENNEINVLISIIKSSSVSQPRFKKLKFDFETKLTFDRIVKNCIALFYLKHKILKIEVRRGKLGERREFNKLNKKFVKFLKDLPLLNKQNENSHLMQLSNTFFDEYDADLRYFSELKHNKKSSKEILYILDHITDEGKRSTSRKLDTANKNLDMCLSKFTTSKDIFLIEDVYDLAKSEEDRNLVHASINSDITQVQFKMTARRLLLKIKDIRKRRRNAKILTKKFGIDFSKMDDLFDI
jgi:hypothetical protein